MEDEIKYDCVYRGKQPEGRRGTRCRRIAAGVGSYYSAVQIEFEDGVQIFVNRNTVRPATLCQVRTTENYRTIGKPAA